MREKEILPLLEERLGITEPNTIQRKMMEMCVNHNNIILISPTGSGKTLAFLLPVLKLLRPSTGRLQAVIIAPGRELVTQIASIAREIAAGYKVTALYGGHKVEDEINSLSVTPDIIVATPGRLLDHAVRGNVDLTPVRILVLDEFDKSLELGFADEMERIIKRLKNVSHTYLTSATDLSVLPDYIKLDNPLKISQTDNDDDSTPRNRMHVHRVDSDSADKLEALRSLLLSLANADGTINRTIVFVNHRESSQRIYNWLSNQKMPVGIYHGALNQNDREKAIALFNNGTTPILIATDLAARGLDISAVGNIIHYHHPLKEEDWVHRNGRTARVDREGEIYVITGPSEKLAPYIDIDDDYTPATLPLPESIHTLTSTLYIGGGKKDKISRGDILGYLVKTCGLDGSEVGTITVYDRYALAAIPSAKAKMAVRTAKTSKIKGKKLIIGIANTPT